MLESYEDSYDNLFNNVLDNLLVLDYDPECYYSNNHICLKRYIDNIFLIGIDCLVSRWLSFVSSIILVPEKENLFFKQPFGWIIQDGKTFSLYSPVNATIISHNKKAINTPDIIRNNPVEEAWLLKVQLENQELELNKLFYGKRAENILKEEIEQLKSKVYKILKEDRHTELITLPDGKKFVNSIYYLLPKKYYIGILTYLLSLK